MTLSGIAATEFVGERDLSFGLSADGAPLIGRTDSVSVRVLPAGGIGDTQHFFKSAGHHDC